MNSNLKLNIESGKYIKVFYQSYLKSIAKTILEHYDTVEFSNTLFDIGQICNIESTQMYYPSELKYQTGCNRLIFYQLEQLTLNHPFHIDTLKPWMESNEVDEIWDYSLPENSRYYTDKMLSKVKFKPMRYTTWFEQFQYSKSLDPRYDFLFIGVVAPDRYDKLNRLSVNTKFNRTIITWGRPIYNSLLELSLSKYVLNLKQHNLNGIQNQVRIYELLGLNCTVVSEKDDFNYFSDLIYQFNNISELFNFDKSQLNPKEKYKELTYSIEAYDNYRLNILKQFNYNESQIRSWL